MLASLSQTNFCHSIKKAKLQKKWGPCISTRNNLAKLLFLHNDKSWAAATERMWRLPFCKAALTAVLCYDWLQRLFILNGSYPFHTHCLLPRRSQAVLCGVALVSRMSAAALRIFRILSVSQAPSWTTPSLWREVFQRQLQGHTRYYHTLWLYRTCLSHRREGQCHCCASVVDLPEC